MIKMGAEPRGLSSRRTMLAGAIALCASVAVSGCSSTPDGDSAQVDDTPKPQRIEVSITAAANINPTAAGQAAPLALQIFTLRSAGRFETLDYFSLRDNGGAAVAGDVVDRRSFSVRPGETRDIILNATDATALAVAGGFRDIDSANWRSVRTISPDSEAFVIRVGASSVRISAR